MRSASVGFQCPECVAEGAKSVREARTAFGGRLSGDTSRLSIGLIVANLAVFALGLALGERALQVRFGNLAGAPGVVGVADGELYRLVTAAFLHAGVFHLAMNMLALASVGPALESALGRARFAVLYVLSAVGGSTLSYLVSDPRTLGVGASGAIFGLFGAYYVVVRRLGGPTQQILVLLGINLVITFSVPIIDWRAHLGGLLTGLAVAAVFAYAPRSRRTRLQTAGCLAIAAALVLAIALRTVALA